MGVDVGGTKMLAVTVDDARNVVGERRVPTPEGATALIDAFVAVIDAQRAECPVDAVGIGAAGLVDRDGVLHLGPNLPGIRDLAIKTLLEERLQLPVQVDNDATCAAWGERELGAAKGSDDAVVVTFGTGIGGGLVLDGRLSRGAHGFAGEVGHMKVDPDGPPCPCGGRGCWERYASGSALARYGREAGEGGRATRVVELAGGDFHDVRGEHVGAAAREGDPEALEIMNTFAWWVAQGLANLADIFDPDTIVVGGGMLESVDLFLDRTREVFPQLVLAGSDRPPVDIVPAQLGERAGAIGAALVARELP
ncbi:MAG TPA: ROK family glucokinase [Acidimicrobiales bacterium]|nr:ROK family glucokinase [Acidimicrobiales bacterium]